MAKLHSHLRRGLKLDIMYGCEVSYCFLLTYPFHTTGLFLYPPENRISDVFRGYKKRRVP